MQAMLGVVIHVKFHVLMMVNTTQGNEHHNVRENISKLHLAVGMAFRERAGEVWRHEPT